MICSLSSIQKGVYLECTANPASTLYNLPFLGRFHEAVDPEKLRAALLKAVNAHPALNSVLAEDGDGNACMKTDESPFEIPIIALSDEDFAERKKTLVRPFELHGGKLSRIEIYQTETSLWLFEDMHHLIYDGSSWSVFAEDVRRALDGQEPKAETVSAFEQAERESAWLAGPEAEEAAKYWDSLLSDCEGDCEPERDRWEEEPSQGWLIRDFSLDEGRFSALRHRAGCSTSAFFTAAFACLTAVFTGQEDVLFNTIVSGRDEENANTVGMLVRTTPFRMKLREQGSVDAFLAQANAALQDGRLHSRYPYLKLAETYGLRPRLEFGYQRDLTENPLVAGCDIEVERLYDEAHVEAASVLFEVCRPTAGCYRVHMGYRIDRFSSAWAESFADAYLKLVRELFEKTDLQELSLVPEEELRLLDSFNNTETPRDPADIVTRFRRCAKSFPDDTAIVAEGRRYSYARADRITDALAGYLRARGIGKGKVVSILIPRDEFMPLASLGVLKSGAAYQPLDPSYPAERLRFMIEDAEASLLIADRNLIGKLENWQGQTLYTDEILKLPDAKPFDAAFSPEDLFVLLYTSGTTGTPKGAMIRHGNVAELAAWAQDYYKMDESTRCAAYASFGFDAHMAELYPTLTCGGALYIIPDEIRLDLGAIAEFVNQNGITLGQMTTQVGRQFALAYEGGSLRDLMVGGEALVPLDPAKIHFTLHNAYGPSECTVLATIQPVDRLYHRIPVGKALENVKLYVVNKQLRRLPLFAPGELLIAGPRVAGGYLHLPEKTAASFIENTFSKASGYERVYRTGDVVRMLPDGRVDFIGRRDSQVKVRGFRIELSEVEGVIRQFPGIRDATVQAFADEKTGMKYLAAYVVSDGPVDVPALNTFIKERKPPYMVPAVTMQLDAIPLTQNQKVNKRALPLPKREETEREGPATEDERLAFDCAAEALGHRDFGVTTDLEDAGLSSIGAMRLNVLLSKAFRRTVRFGEMKSLHTVRDIAAFFASGEEEHSYALQKSYPLSSVQQGVYAECLANPGSTVYNIPLLLKLDASVDLVRLKAALSKTIDAHPYLKTRLDASSGGEIAALRDDGAEIEIAVLEKENLREGFSELVRPFNLTKEPLLRVALILDKPSAWLFLDAHHLIFDGESLVVFLRDLENAYAGKTLRKESFTGFEAALDEQQRRQSTAFEEARRYYAGLLEGVEPDCLPVRDRNEAAGGAGRLSRSVSLDRSELGRFLSEAKTTPNALWNAAFGFTLSKFLGREDCVYTTVYNGRSDTRLSDSVGMFVHTLPVVCRPLAGETGRSFASRIGRELSDSMANDIFSFAEISRDFGVRADILFVYEGAIGTGFTVGGKAAERIELHASDALKAALTFFVYDTQDGYRIECEYETAHYEDWDILSLLESVETALRAFVRDEALDSISLLTPEREAQLAAFNRTECPIEETDVASIFRRSARADPEHSAVIFGEKHVSYRELDELSDRIAAYASGLGLGPEDVVSILIPRSEMMAVTALGVLKAGSAYQPLDPSYPSERLQFMVDDAGAKLLIADESLTELLPDYKGPVLLLRDIPSLPEAAPPVSRLTPDSLFILLYTSGTTGTPKGVMLTHKNLVNFCAWYRTHYALGPDSVVAAYASFGFDANMMDLWPALTSGAAVCVVPEEMRLDLPELNRYYEQNGVTHVFMTTQMGRMFAFQIQGSSIRHLSVGGEKLVPIAPPKGYSLTNGYGPTECTIFSTTQPVDRLYDRIPIGSALPNYKLYVVDRNGRELPVGAMGELWIAGCGVGRGYLNQPERTEKVFTPNPFCTEPGFDRVYRTGDIVRRLGDGRIDFIGRSDGQVKVRGFRIELSEVEGVIRQFPGIRDATVQAFADEETGMKNLAAYVVSDTPVDIPALNAFIKERKPPYMVPAVTMQIDAIPLTQNQKVNRKALPKPELKTRSSEQGSAAPLNILEQEIMAIAAEVLHAGGFGVTERFGDLGLSSISAIRLAMLIYKRFQVEVNARELVSEGCIQSVENAILAALLKKDAEQPETPAEEKKPAARSCRLSFAQQGVYTEYQANPDTVQYNIPLAVRFPEGTDAQELENAVRSVVEAHPYLLCRFVPNDENEIIQEPIPDCRLDIPFKELSAEEFENDKKAFVRPFDLAKGPAVRFEIVKTDRLWLLADMHHLVSDGASVDLFLTQLCRSLDGEALEKESYSYYDFASEEEIAPETEAFFAARMGNAEEATRLIPDVFDETLPHRERNVTVPTDIAAVKAYARRCGVTPAAVYLAACHLAFARYVCEDTVAIATVSNGRSNLKLANTMGMFVNTLPLVASIDHKEKTADFLRRTAKDFSDTIAHENYPFARIASKYDFHPSVSYTYQIGVLNEYRTERGPVELGYLNLDIAKLPVSVYIEGTEEAARIQVAYDSALYSEAMMLGLAESIENAVRGLMTAETLSGISLTGEAQWKVLDGYNRPWDLGYDKSDTVVTRFKRNVEAQPDKTAAVYKDKAYTYRELDELTDRLAAKLYKRACALTGKTDLAEEAAAILIHRDENVFLLPLAAVKAGLAYEPLDPSYPKERLNFMVKDAKVCLLLAEDELLDLVDEYEGPVLTVSELCAMEDAEAVPKGPSPEDLFILLYTSGSTGTPKGCQIEHRNVVSYAYGVRNDFYTKDDRIAAYASFGFDVNMSDVFCTILNGGTVYLIPEEIRMELGALAAYFDEAGITALLLTTQVGVQFLLNYPRLKTLRMLVMGGEKLPAVDPSRLSYTIVNGYGPTENCCGVSLFPIGAWEPNIPIGKPMGTIHGYVLDKTGHRLPAGAAGEYCLSGPQVSRGYLNRPDKTQEAYEPCPFNEFRMYHTGDIVRYRQNGDVEFVGRKDGQVKIRGFRIETKEVESVIRGFAGVRDVTVQAYDYESGGKYLAAFVVGDAPVDIAALTDYIKARKPAYMVPAVITQIEKIPLTVNQKVDKKALPEPRLQKAAYVAPEGKAEEDFCAVFGGVLGLERVSAEDDFFDIGGSSILAMKVVMAAEKAGYKIVYNDVFSYPTPRAMAGFLTGRGGNAEAPAEVLTGDGDGTATEIGRDGYDYREIHALLRRNTLEAFRKGERQPLNDVLLLGATGYLGSHVLHELIVSHDNKICCFIRPGKGQSGQERLQKLLRYYFGDDFAALFGNRITVIEGDATNADDLMAFEAPSTDMTVVNCAASVKHFARGDEIERANVDSVRSLTAWCEKNKARLIHISTGSVAGSRENGVPPLSFRFDEHSLYAGQVVDNNQYVHSKFMAERHVYEEILKNGLRAKVFRMGNLAPRAADGEFQINYTTNSYMNSFRAYQTLGMIPYEGLAAVVEFSPIDCLARAVLALSQTPDDCVCFIPLNPHRPLLGDVIRALNEEGYAVRGAEPEAFAEALHEALSDEQKREAVSSLAAYSSGDNTQAIGLESCDNSLTLQILERLGFSWPETGVAYIRQFVKKLGEKGFFGGREA